MSDRKGSQEGMKFEKDREAERKEEIYLRERVEKKYIYHVKGKQMGTMRHLRQ